MEKLKYYSNIPALDSYGALVDFPCNSTLFKFKQKIAWITGNDGTKAVQIMVSMKHLSD